MKALSLQQPWLDAVLLCGKRVENRQRIDRRMPGLCKHRGPLLLHASLSFDHGGYAWLHDRGLLPRVEPGSYQRGGILGRCVVIAHVDSDGRVWLDPEGTEQDPDVTASVDLYRWHMRPSYALVLADVEPLPFTPWKGALGLFEVDESRLVKP